MVTLKILSTEPRMAKKYLFSLFLVCLFEFIGFQYLEAKPIFQVLVILFTIFLLTYNDYAHEYCYSYYVKNNYDKFYLILTWFISIPFYLLFWLGIVAIFVIVDVYEQKPLRNWFEYFHNNINSFLKICLPFILINGVNLIRKYKKDINNVLH